MMKECVEKLKAKVIFHTFLSSLYIYKVPDEPSGETDRSANI